MNGQRELEMKISRVEAIPFRVRLAAGVGPIRSSIWAMNAANHVLIKVTTNDGLEGYGEATERPTLYGETQSSICAAVGSWLGPPLLGLDPFDLEKIWDRMDKIAANNTAKGAIDIAVHDLLGKRLGLPVHKLLGSWDGQKVRASSLLPFGTPEKTASLALERMRRQGIRAFKVKVGKDPDRDVKTFIALREALGEEALLYVDANQGWTPDQAVRAIREMEPYGLAWVEEPVKKGDFAGKLRVSDHIGVPLLLDESATTPEEVWHQIRMGMNCLINIKTTRTGFYNSRKILHLAEAANIACMVGTTRETGVGTAASLQFASSFKNIQVAEVADYEIYEHTLLETPFRIEDGFAHVPAGSGLGLAISPEALARYKVKPG